MLVDARPRWTVFFRAFALIAVLLTIPFIACGDDDAGSSECTEVERQEAQKRCQRCLDACSGCTDPLASCGSSCSGC